MKILILANDSVGLYLFRIDLIKKLLKKSAFGTAGKIEEVIQNHLKQQEVKK